MDKTDKMYEEQWSALLKAYCVNRGTEGCFGTCSRNNVICRLHKCATKEMLEEQQCKERAEREAFDEYIDAVYVKKTACRNPL